MSRKLMQHQEFWVVGQNLPIPNRKTRFEKKCQVLGINPDNIEACASSPALVAYVQSTVKVRGKMERFAHNYYVPEALLSELKMSSGWETFDDCLPNLSF